MKTNTETESQEIEPCAEKLSCGDLISLIGLVRNDANHSTNLLWRALERQLILTSALIVILSLALEVTGDWLIRSIVAALIGSFGAMTCHYHKKAAHTNWIHGGEYNKSCRELENYLPEPYRNYAVIHTYDQRIERKIEKTKPILDKMFTGLIYGWSFVAVIAICILLTHLPVKGA